MLASDRIALAALVVAVIAASISALSLLSTIILAVWGLRYTKEQIRQNHEQLAEAKSEFLANAIPEIEMEMSYSESPKRDIVLAVRNHHLTAHVTILKAIAIGYSPAGKEAFQLTYWSGTESYDLRATKHVKIDSDEGLDFVFSKLSIDSKSVSCEIRSKPSGSVKTVSFPLKLQFSFLPRFFGAQKVERDHEVFLEIGYEPNPTVLSQASNEKAGSG